LIIVDDALEEYPNKKVLENLGDIDARSYLVCLVRAASRPLSDATRQATRDGTVPFRPSVQSRITAKKITHPKCFSFDLSDFFGIFFDNFFPNV
jgi:hypothetical protein